MHGEGDEAPFVSTFVPMPCVRKTLITPIARFQDGLSQGGPRGVGDLFAARCTHSLQDLNEQPASFLSLVETPHLTKVYDILYVHQQLSSLSPLVSLLRLGRVLL